MTTFHAPGRINLIGDHIDYMGGTVLPMAIDRGTDLTLSPRTDQLIAARSANFPESATTVADLRSERPVPEWGWVNYLVAVAFAMRSSGHQLDTGFDVEVAGTIPNGAGLSSSASLQLAFAVALNAHFDFGISRTELALICQQAENNFIGVSCGIMDQLSIAHGRQGFALAINCANLTVTDVPFPSDVAIVVANSNKRRELADSAYNERRAACERAEAQLDSGRLVDVSPDQLGDVLAGTAADDLRRVRHVATEQQRVLACIQALELGDLPQVGDLMRQSHESLRDDFEVTGPELDALAQAAWDTPGTIGARMTGAGFGGCTVNLVEPAAVDRFISQVGSTYTSATGLKADFYQVRSADGAAIKPDAPK